MTIGTSIVLAAILPTAVFLFAVTKDRWNWRRIVMWGLLLASMIAILIVGIHFYSNRKSKPAENQSFLLVSKSLSQLNSSFFMTCDYKPNQRT